MAMAGSIAPSLPAGATGPDQFLVSPPSLNFGSLAIGTKSPAQVVNITNVSGASTVLSVSGGGAPGPFSDYQNCVGATLAPGASCQFTYFFTPSATGKASATSSGKVNGQSFSIALRGTGTASETAR
jgi:hypothetical protein